MKLSILLLLCALPALLPAQSFTVEATEDAAANFPGAPHISSASFGQWEGKWIFIGGRIAGYHGVGGATADFPRPDANHDVWVIDTTAHPAKTYHVPALNDAWAATSQLAYQDSKYLYIAGGYGQDSNGNWVTFDTLTRIDLPSLIKGVMHGSLPPAAISTTHSPAVQSTGGELIKLSDGFFYLVMGHKFMGTYSAFEGSGEKNTATASQVYLNEIRKLKITSDTGGRLSVSLADSFCDNNEFHRRDLNVAKILHPGGDGLAVFGGVFTPDTQLSYSKPVYLLSAGQPVVESDFEQKMNAYASARLLLYDKHSGKMYTNLFGGISRYSWDESAHEFRANPLVGSKPESSYLDGMQWSDRISTLETTVANGKASTVETVQPKALPAFIGTQGVFIPAEDLARAKPDSDILDLHALPPGKTFAGYLYGGVQAFPYQFPYTSTAKPYNSGAVPTRPSALIVKVYIRH